MNHQPELIIIAGPNGAGKTTFVNTYLPEYTNVREFVNADLIAKGMSPFDSEGVQIEACKIFLNRVRQLIESRTSFSFESTLSGKTHIALIKAARANGYAVRLYFIYLNSVSLSLERIAERVGRGGHDVPSDIVVRRYGRSLRNLIADYLPLVDDWQLFDNSDNSFREIARELSEERFVADEVLFNHLIDEYGNH